MKVITTHGSERNYHREIKTVNSTFIDRTTGEEFTVPIGGSNLPACEKYCARCGRWVECIGLFALIICPGCNQAWDEPIEVRHE